MAVIRPVAATLIAVLWMAGFAIPVSADAIQISGTFSGDSSLTPTASPGIFAQAFAGDGDDTIFGSFTAQSNSTIDFSGSPKITISDGSLIETFAQGKLFGTSSGSGTASGHGTATVTLDFVFTGGTGLFTGATGEATATENVTVTGPTTDSITGSYTGSISGVPGPIAGAGLPSIVLVGGGLLAWWRCRRKSSPA